MRKKGNRRLKIATRNCVSERVKQRESGREREGKREREKERHENDAERKLSRESCVAHSVSIANYLNK